MAEKGTHGVEPNKTLSDAERSRREAAVNYARASVSLEGFSLSPSDDEHA